MINIGLLGVGQFGARILKTLKQLDFINVTSFSSDISYESIETSYLDWIVIATPTELHYEHVKFFLNKGINVFCEKPCTLSYESTKELIDLAKSRNIKLYIDDVFTYDNICITDNKIIYKKWSKPVNNIVDRIIYHHLYLLYNEISDIYTDLQILRNDFFNKHFTFVLNNVKYEFEYDLHYYKQRIHNIIVDRHDIDDPLTKMFSNVFNDTVSYDLNHRRALFATKLSEQLKQDLYGTVAVVGAGIYGITAAIKLRDTGFNVDLYEKEDDILKAASGINQYRIHRGYHYPRSKETIISCRDNERIFTKYYRRSILKSDIKHLYSIASNDSLINASNYLKTLDANNLEWHIENTMSNCDLTISVNEKLYDPNQLKSICYERLNGNGINLKLSQAWYKTNADRYKYIVYATYASLNDVTDENFKYQFELCEKPIVKLPDRYKNTSIVIMDGPFMCFDPYGDTDYHLCGNVVHAIHVTNISTHAHIPDVYKKYINKGIVKNPKYTNIQRFIESSKIFFSDIENAIHIGSMFTIRTVLPNTDNTDERPTIVRKKNNKEFVIFSGKIVNCIDAANKLISMIYE